MNLSRSEVAMALKAGPVEVGFDLFVDAHPDTLPSLIVMV